MLEYDMTREAVQDTHVAHPETPKVREIVIRRFGDLVKVNVLFVVACLPIVTIPVAMCAATGVLRLLLDGRVVFIWHDFATFWKKYWRCSLIAGLPGMAVTGVGILGAWFYLQMDSSVGIVLSGICGAVVVCTLASHIYLYPMMEMTKFDTRTLWHNSLTLVPLNLKDTVVVLLLDIVILGGGLLLLPYSFFVLPLFGLSLMGLFGTDCATKAIRRFVIQDDSRQEL